MFQRIDHIGIAVLDLESELARYKKDFGLTASFREVLESQQVSLAFLDLPGSTVELLAPTSDTSTLSKFLKVKGAGLHHICYQVQDIRESLKQLEKKNYKLIDRTPRPGARHTEIAFIHPASCNGVLVELCQYI